MQVNKFQSAPLTEARGDVKASKYTTSGLLFQSAPLTEARGDIRRSLLLLRLLVSIRSPHRSKGRRMPLSKMVAFCLFQSAPLTEARGDWMIFAPLAATLTFQSAPLTEARGDLLSAAERRAASCFNPLPSPKQGETLDADWLGWPKDVSIRSPHRSKGRPATHLPKP